MWGLGGLGLRIEVWGSGFGVSALRADPWSVDGAYLRCLGLGFWGLGVWRFGVFGVWGVGVLGFGGLGVGLTAEGLYVAAAHDEQARPLSEAVYLV